MVCSMVKFMLLSVITGILMTVTWKFWFLILFFYSAFVFLILLMDGDIDSNPGPKSKTKKPNFFHESLECQ